MDIRRRNKRKYIDLRETARISGYTSDYIGYLIRKGKIKGKRILSNISWQIAPGEIIKYCEKKKNLEVRDSSLLKKKYLSLKEAAKLSGYASDYIGYLIRKGKISGKRVYSGISWMTTEKAIRKYREKKKLSGLGAPSIFRWSFYFSLKVPKYAIISAILGIIIFSGLVAWAIAPKAQIQTVEIYSTQYAGDWQNPQNVKGQPEVGPDRDFNSFSEADSAVYQGGPLSLVLSDFNNTQTDLEIEISEEQELESIEVESQSEETQLGVEETEEPQEEQQEQNLEEGGEEGQPGEIQQQEEQEINNTEQEESSVINEEESFGEEEPVQQEIEESPIQSSQTETESLEEEPISFFEKVKRFFGNLTAKAQQVPTFEELNETQFQSAKIKFSFAIGEKIAEFTPIIEETGPEIPPIESASPPQEEIFREEGEIESIPELPPPIETTTPTSFWNSSAQIFFALKEKLWRTTQNFVKQAKIWVGRAKNFFGTLVAKAQEDIPLIETTTPPVEEFVEEFIEMEEEQMEMEEEQDGETEVEVPETEIISELPALDTKIIIWYSTDGENWWELDTISSYPLSNGLNGGYFSYDVPFLKNWEDIKNLKIKFEGVIGGETTVIAYLDSVWVEVSYQEKEEEKESSKIELLSNKKDFRANEEPEFRFRYKKINKSFLASVGEILGIINDWQNINITTQIVDPEGKILEISADEFGGLTTSFSFENNGEFLVTLRQVQGKPREFKPGLYKIILKIEDDGNIQEFEQDFSWGVLAINTNKSIYLLGETAYLQMAVLRDDGHTICNANLVLSIKYQVSGMETSLSTEDGTIQYSGECGPDNVTDVPDYFAYYQVDGSGKYEMKLTNLDNGYEIIDSFEVRESVPFDIERIGPTRIYPPSAYKMKIKIKANQDFKGKVVESVPSSFAVISPESQITIKNNPKEITWQVDWKMGETYEKSYLFDAPDISPYLYLLGPLRFTEDGPLQAPVFQEIRQWQIAADATATLRPNAAGYKQEWSLTDTTHYGATSDQLDTTYVYVTTSTTLKETENLQDPTFDDSATINSVTVYARCCVFGGGGSPERGRIITRTGGTDYESDKFALTDCPPTDAWTDHSVVYNDNPGGGSWTKAQITALEIGSKGDTLATGEEMRCSEYKAVVDYTLNPTFTQNDYRWYVNADSVDVTDPWPETATDLNENTPITSSDSPPASGDILRIRMNLTVGTTDLNADTQAFKLQYGQGTDCTAIGTWNDVDAISGSGIWRGYDNTTPADGTTLTSYKLSVSDVNESYEENNPSVNNPNAIAVNQDGEWDWVIQHNGASAGTTYCFKMVKSDGTALNTYNSDGYPKLITAVPTFTQNDYRWYVNADSVDVTDPWPETATDLNENTPITSSDSPPASGDILRIRMNLTVGTTDLNADTQAFKLQYGQGTDCTAIGTWNDVDAISGSGIWRGYDNTTAADGESLETSFGSEYAFNPATTTGYISVSALSSTHFVVAYRDEGNSNSGTAIIGTVSDSTISYGSEYVFNEADITNYISASALDSTHFVVSYRDEGNLNYGTAIIGTVSDSTIISYGSEYVFNSALTSSISVSALDSTKFVVSYEDEGNSDYGTAIIGTVSDSTISYGSEYAFNEALTSYISASALDSTKFVVSYRDGADTYGRAIIGTVSDSTIISYGSEYAFNEVTTNWISVSALTSTKFVVSYRDGGGALYYGTAIIGTVSDSTIISYGSEYVFNSAGTSITRASALDSTHFVVNYLDEGNSDYGTAIIGTVSDTNIISYGSEYVFNEASTTSISVSALTSTKFVVSYRDGADTYGRAIIGTGTSDTKLSTSDVGESYEEANPSVNNPNAISNGDDGEWDWVIQHNGATAGTTYCFKMVKSDGTALNTYNSDGYPKLITASVGIDISGRVCSTESCTGSNGSSVCNGVATNVGLSVEGGAPTYVDCDSGTGAFLFSTVTISSSQTATLFINEETEDATLVMVVASSNISDADFYENKIVVRAETGTIGSTEMAKYDSDDQANDIRFQAVASTSVTVEAGHELHIWTGDTFQPGGTVTLTVGSGSDLHIDDSATFTAGGAISIGGSWTAGTSTTFTHNNNNVTFTSTTTGQTITTNAQNFYNLIFSGSGGEWTPQDTVTVANNLTTTTGTLLGTQNINVNGGGITGTNGSINLTSSSTTTLSGAGNLGPTGTGTYTFYDLTLSGSTATTTLAGDITVSSDVSIGADRTLALNDKNLDVNGGALTTTTTGSITCSGCTAGKVTIPGTGDLGGGAGSITFYNLDLGDDTETGTTTAQSNFTVLNVFSIEGSTNQHIFNAGSKTVTLSGTGTPFVINGTFTSSTSTVSYTGNGATNVTSTTYYTLSIGTNNSANIAYTAAGAIIANNEVNLQSAASSYTNTFDMSTYDLTVGLSSVSDSGGISVPVRSTFSQSASGTTTIKSSSGGSATIGGAGTITFYNLSFLPDVVSAPTFTLGSAASQTINVSGALTIGNGTDLVTVTALDNDPILNIDGDFSNSASATFVASNTAAFYVGGDWSNSATGTFTHSGGTVTFDAGSTGKTISDGGDPFSDIVFDNTNGGWTYTDGSSTAPSSTTVTNGTATYINAKTGTVSVASGGTLYVDWYLGTHVVNAADLSNIDTDSGCNDITISENETSDGTVWRYDGGWGSGATSQTTATGTTCGGPEAGKNPQPTSTGAIKIREYKNVDGSYTYYKYNLQITWQDGYGEYDYYTDYGGKYLSSTLNTACSTNCDLVISGEDTTSPACTSQACRWHRPTAGSMNSPYSCSAGTDSSCVDEPPNNGSWYIGMLKGLEVTIVGTSISFDELTMANNFTNTASTSTEIRVTTSSVNGYIVTAWETQLMTCSDSGQCGSEEISNFTQGTYADPDPWITLCKDNTSYCGFGFTSDDPLVEGENRYNDGNEYTYFPNDSSSPVRVSDNSGPIYYNQSGSYYSIGYRISVSPTQRPGPYATTIVYIVTVQY